ncbi:hypothetical protein FI667_g14959, partial [Globisporangium splendens]
MIAISAVDSIGSESMRRRCAHQMAWEESDDTSDSSSSTIKIHNADASSQNQYHGSVTKTGRSQTKTPSRYLRGIDRRAILARIEKGESHSSLARECSVSRSAICSPSKKREQALARGFENPYAMHVRMKRTKPRNRSKLPASGVSMGVFDPVAPGVRRIQTRAIVHLASTLLDSTPPGAIFGRYADRLMLIFLEEASVLIQLRNRDETPSDLEATTTNGEMDRSLASSPSAASGSSLCAVTMEQQYCLMLEHLLIVAPEVSSGYARFHFHRPKTSTQTSQNESPIVTLLSANLPESLDQQSVMLLDNFMCEEENRALNDVTERLLARGALEKHIVLLTIFISGKVVDWISRKYPDLLILAVDIGGSPDDITKYETIRSRLFKRYKE